MCKWILVHHKLWLTFYLEKNLFGLISIVTWNRFATFHDDLLFMQFNHVSQNAGTYRVKYFPAPSEGCPELQRPSHERCVTDAVTKGPHVTD